MSVILDAGAAAYDEDELLAAIGFARALGAHPIVHFTGEDEMAAVEDVVDEICQGMVARYHADVERISTTITRRHDLARARRFEFVTVSPRDGEILAILGDGHSVLMQRPLTDADDGSPIISISLGENADVANLGLGSGVELLIYAARVSRYQHTSSGELNTPVDGPRLGARLRTLRKQAGLTQAELARRTGIHRPNIARVEAGRHTPSLETLSRLANAIGVPTSQVLLDE